MRQEVVAPVSQATSPIVPGRTRLLVQVLEQARDSRAIPALISLVKPSQAEPLLAIAVIRALSQFPTQQVVAPLLEMLESPQPQIYEEAIEALSSLGDVALDELIAALDVQRETATTQRIRRAILGMASFPGEQLLSMLPRSSDAQARQILTIFQLQGADAAHVLVEHLFDEDKRIKSLVHRTLSAMQGQIIVPPLLEALNRPGWSDTIATFLLNYPEVAMPPLVNLLGDPERGDVAASILPRFGPRVLTPLIVALDDTRIVVQEHTQNIIITLVHQNPATLSHVVRLFGVTLPLRAHEALMELLINDLVDVSVPALLDGLEDAHLVDDVSEALARLARKRDWQRIVLNGLLESLRMEERRRGAETALIKVGAQAVRSVGELITDQDEVVARAAQHILQEIGAPALPFIWAAHGDTSNHARREAAMNIFHNMPTEEIKDALVNLLTSDQPGDIAMAQALLLERIHDEETLSAANQEMIPALIQYVQIHERERTSLRIMALLFLQGGDSVVRHLVKALYDYPEHYEQLVHAFLFLGDEANIALLKILNNPHAPVSLRAEAISMIGLLGASNEVYEYAQSVSKYGLSSNRTGISNAEGLTISLRALGSLLASGDWDVPTLQHLRQITPEGSPQSDLYNVLLGRRYEPEMLKLKNDLQNERDARKSEIMSLTARIVQDQARFHELEDNLKLVQHEHGLRGNELSQATQERDALRRNLNQTEQEKERYRVNLEKSLQEQQALQAEINQLEADNTYLQQQNNLLRGKTQA
jgi:HEAT repeat protein